MTNKSHHDPQIIRDVKIRRLLRFCSELGTPWRVSTTKSRAQLKNSTKPANLCGNGNRWRPAFSCSKRVSHSLDASLVWASVVSQSSPFSFTSTYLLTQ